MKSSSLRINYKSFPFAPGILWNIKNGKYILPYLELNKINSFIKDNPIKIVCYGGLIESFFSLSILEAYNFYYKNDLYWIGNPDFKDLISWQGLAKFDNSFPKEKIYQFPTPLFKDLSGNIYCNSLLNYRNIKTYYGIKIKHNASACFNQIFNNSLFQEWDNKYIPCFRAKNKINKIGNLVVIFPDASNFCNQEINCLKLSKQELKSLNNILTQYGYKCIFLTDNIDYNGMHAEKLNLDNIFTYLQQASFVLSNQVDFLLLSLLISKAKVIYNFPLKNRKVREFILDKNFFFLNKKYSSQKQITFLKDPDVMQIVSNILE